MNQKLLLLLLFISLSVSGQEFMSTKDTKKFPATKNWDFICESYALTGILKVQIAKKDQNGILKLAVETTNPNFKIVGTVYVYLKDNSIISCLDKGNITSSGKEIISFYTFSQLGMNRLKKTTIASIRFNIKGDGNEFSSQVGNFTGLNKKNYFATAFDKSEKNYDTAKEVLLLY
jgi:hypothetical protein